MAPGVIAVALLCVEWRRKKKRSVCSAPRTPAGRGSSRAPRTAVPPRPRTPRSTPSAPPPPPRRCRRAAPPAPPPCCSSRRPAASAPEGSARENNGDLFVAGLARRKGLRGGFGEERSKHVRSGALWQQVRLHSWGLGRGQGRRESLARLLFSCSLEQIFVFYTAGAL
ncbi:hypothetical protein BRADI_5g07612v3 [Brachypodium distachyon]|uniref:Uncharacterized protein n=1 Tax=Brachypodium distachyon TaxID=15368 RepID=A0A2K2CFT0_BRADI|nr:hypothetical protein BRADI_5g07612v3 [Brachypodium distachyon]